MTTKRMRFTPESIQQLKDAGKYLHVRPNSGADSENDEFRSKVELNFIEISNRVDRIRKGRDTFIEQLNSDLDRVDVLLQESFAAITGANEPGEDL
jgi:hypothetical protein